MTVANARSAFLDSQSFSTEVAPEPPPAIRAAPSIRSPFISVYEMEEGESVVDDPVREAFASFVNELHDEEFDEALFELHSRARALHDEQLASGTSRAEADRVVTQHFSELIRESEAMVDAVARQFASRDETGIVESEVESFVEGYAPSASLEPEFENFFGKLAKKVAGTVKKVAGKAWQGIKKIGLGPILNKLRGLIRPLLQRVLKWAIGKLPVVLQPAAHKLAEKLGFAAPKPAQPAASATAQSAADAAAASVDASATPEDVGTSVQDATGEDPAALQQELDEQIAEAFLAQDEVEINLEVAQASTAVQGNNPVFAELDDARERFIRELETIEQGESAAPHIENFVPALLPAIKLGMKLAGRKRIVDFLANMLGKLIGKLIGPAQAPALSRAIVDAGLRLINLEISDQERSGLAASAVAATVEETVARVASLPDHILDNQELLEGFMLEAFEQAAAANLPSLFSAETYRQRPELLEAGVNAGWVLLPLRGPRRYKRCSRMFKVRVSPYMAEAVESFDGLPLSEYLQDQLGLPPGQDVEAEMHLYETLPGTTVADIAHAESETLGAGASVDAATSLLHPLTPQAASVLLGKPGLGRALRAGSHGRYLAAGQRLFHLAVPGKRLLTMPGRGRPRARRLMHINLTLDGTSSQIRACIFLSEVKAQKLAMRLREPAGLGRIAVKLDKMLARAVGPILQGKRPRRLRLVYAGLRPGQPASVVLRNLPPNVSQALATKLQEWLLQGLTEFLKTQSQRLFTATEDPADGVTLLLTIEHPPGLKELGQALAEKGHAASSLAETIAAGERPNVRVDVVPGHRCG